MGTVGERKMGKNLAMIKKSGIGIDIDIIKH